MNAQTKISAADLAIESLNNARNGKSKFNYETIYSGFMDKGIAKKDIRPRKNVFTFNAWKALGRTVKKGEHGVKVLSIVVSEKLAEDTGESYSTKRGRLTSVFHISQTESIAEYNARVAKPAPDTDTAVGKEAARLELIIAMDTLQARLAALAG